MEGDGGRLFADINITPLIDVVLVLLLVFMVSSSAMLDAVQEGRLDLKLPPAGQAQAKEANAVAIVVGMDAEGRVFVDGQEMAETTIGATLATLHREGGEPLVVIDADGALSHAKVVQMLDRIRAAGFQSVAIGAEPMP